MSMHSSLKRGDKLKGSRSVLTKRERIKWLMNKKRWDDSSSVYGLPKIKIIKLKLAKKSKKAEEKTGEEQQQKAEKKSNL
ncbi:MAG: small basic protein [Candidatus Omnitrophica bacterium]|nr:small basic protein [Candidatus Omnitrophota bacterium]